MTPCVSYSLRFFNDTVLLKFEKVLIFLKVVPILGLTTPDVSTDGCGLRGRIFFIFMKQATYVYIDGFNLYHRLKRAGSAKWLDLRRFISHFLDSNVHHISKIKYFTAKVKRNKQDHSNTVRQDHYLMALQHFSNVEIILGKFQKRKLKGILCDLDGNPTGKMATIEKYEEKTSDVNLAVHMIADSYQNKYDCAVLVSNDTDLVPPLLYVKTQLQRTVGVVSPAKKVHLNLRKSASFSKSVATNYIFQNSQLPKVVETPQGSVHCPPKWL